MADDLARPNRRSIRLPHHNYALPGTYFVTICTQGMMRILSSISMHEHRLSSVGEMVKRWWLKIGTRFEHFRTDTYVIMPNHIHGFLVITSHNNVVPLADAVRWFKTMTTNEYIRGVRQRRWRPFDHRFWQRGYYERVLYDERDIVRARQYIIDNPALWKSGTHHRP